MEEDEKILLCFKYNIPNKITFAMRDTDKRYPKCFYSNRIVNPNHDEAVQITAKKRNTKRQFQPNIIISNNPQISKLLYFVDNYMKTPSEQIKNRK
jgi:hypothetical protein